MGAQRFSPAGDPPPVPAPQTKYLTTHTLKEHGWTAAMIAALLPRSNAAYTLYIRLLGKRMVNRYLHTRVEEVELSEEPLLEQERATKANARRGSAACTAQHQTLPKRCVLGFRLTYR